jgi:iron-sulfur cluster repair protein YtfE (RIC family)
MTLDEMRIELLKEHELLRSRLAQIQRLARAIETGEEVQDADRRLRLQVEQLRVALDEHLTREDAILGPIIATIDAWGKERVEAMAREHAAQHAALFTAINETSGTRTPLERAAAARAMARELAAHMDEEEDLLLHPDILTDCLIKTSQLTD